MSQSDELGKLADLHQRGVLTEEEFSRAKARVLSGACEVGAKAPVAEGLLGLCRSRNDRWLGGVCGGVGQFTDMPAWIWRLLFVLFVVCFGTGLLVYVLMWIFMPIEPVGAHWAQPSY
jgi:phage shock protein C